MQPGHLERRIGSYGTSGEEPLLIVVGAVHGNEPAGVRAARAVLDQLQFLNLELRGRYVALIGNLRALAERRRFMRQDLNRIWSDRQVEALEARPESEDGPDQAQQRELLREIRAELEGARGRVILLDLHSTSADGSPFAIIGDTLANRRVAFEFGVPTILGLEENVSGTLLEHFGERGHTAVCFEGGQHDHSLTWLHHVAAIWTTLVSSGMLHAQDVPEWKEHRDLLARAGAGLPRVVEVLHRHAVLEQDDFRMHPGYQNFQPVEKDEVLAHADPGNRAIRSPRDGLILMPRYQAEGSDGFFVARAVRPAWLRVSAWLRRLHLESLLVLLPGVRYGPDRGRNLEVDRRVARWFSLQVFHLLGYRKLEELGPHLLVSRRVEKP